MFYVRENGLTEDFDKYLPSVCTNAPANNKAFCEVHAQLVEEFGYSSNLKEFLESCSTRELEVNTETYTKTQQEQVKEKLKQIASEVENGHPDSVISASEAQGTTYYLRDRNLMQLDNFELAGDEGEDDCNK